VADPIWESLSQKAHAAGISLNQAAQQALLEWINH
jgi:predicted HicB family RNase H-like nuclease